MKRFSLFGGCFLALLLCAYGSSSSSGTGEAYADFGRTTEQALPEGLKTGEASASLSAKFFAKDLSGTCAADYTDCPPVIASGGGDGQTAEILMRLWSIDYNNECTEAKVARGNCFDCVDCQTGMGTTYFIRPRMYEDPTICSSTVDAHYVNMGIDPCFFDSLIYAITNIDECGSVQGGAVDASPVVPWYASWGIPQTVNFSSYYSRETGGGIWWSINSGSMGNNRYFLSLDPNWLYMGIKDITGDSFMFFGTASPAYNQTAATAGGYTTGVNISAFAGTLSAIPAQFETMQIRVQDPQKYIERVKVKNANMWYQRWEGDDFPELPADVDTVKNSPSLNRCIKIRGNVNLSIYVPLTDCVAAFEKASVEELNQDDNYILKVVDGQTASAISFSSALTPTATSSCLPAQ